MLTRKLDVLHHVGLSRGGFDVLQSILVPPSDQLVLDDFVTKKGSQNLHDSSMNTFKKQKKHNITMHQQIYASIDARISQNDLSGSFFQDDDEENEKEHSQEDPKP